MFSQCSEVDSHFWEVKIFMGFYSFVLLNSKVIFLTANTSTVYKNTNKLYRQSSSVVAFSFYSLLCDLLGPATKHPNK